MALSHLYTSHILGPAWHPAVGLAPFLLWECGVKTETRQRVRLPVSMLLSAVLTVLVSPSGLRPAVRHICIQGLALKRGAKPVFGCWKQVLFTAGPTPYILKGIGQDFCIPTFKGYTSALDIFCQVLSELSALTIFSCICEVWCFSLCPRCWSHVII